MTAGGAKRRTYPALAYNPITLGGVAIALFGLAAIVIFYFMSALRESNPYVGIFLFLVFPGILALGLVLIPLGMWLEGRRAAKGPIRPLVIDLGDRAHRNATVTFLVGTSLFLLLTTIGLYETFHYTESVSFCGEVCHAVMEPEFTTYRAASHAEVKCVECHIGAGADWYVKSKISGARQVVKALTRSYPTPIPTPVHNLRPAQDTCEQCHWPGKFSESKLVTIDRYLADEKSSPWRIRLLLKVGGRSAHGTRATGIHWHVDDANRIHYVASDSSRLEFDRVSWKREGEEVVYTPGGLPYSDSLLAERRRAGLERSMDCMDCHNRPAHVFPAPEVAVDAALGSGRLDASIPWIKRKAVLALAGDYESTAEAHDSISAALLTARVGGDKPLRDAVTAVQSIYDQTIFPHMRARWDQYPDHRGHLIFPGCFRCHGSDLATPEGRTISADCDLCHSIVAQGPPDSLEESDGLHGLEFRHPVDVSGSERAMGCFHCHGGGGSTFLEAYATREGTSGG